MPGSQVDAVCAGGNIHVDESAAQPQLLLLDGHHLSDDIGLRRDYGRRLRGVDRVRGMQIEVQRQQCRAGTGHEEMIPIREADLDFRYSERLTVGTEGERTPSWRRCSTSIPDDCAK